jgi:ribonuclease III family protein
LTQYNGQTLAYLGDAIYELLVREYLLSKGITKPINLHDEAVKYTCAEGQYKRLSIIEHNLTEEELSVLKRGRNGNISRKARNVDLKTYQYATGLEALFGYLYLDNNMDRIRELFNLMTAND